MDKNKQLKMGAKFLWTASLILILISCQSEKKEIKIRFTANEKNYEISAKDKAFICEVTYDTFTNKSNMKQKYDYVRHKSITLSYLSNLENKKSDEYVMKFLFRMCSDDPFPDSAKVIYEDFSCKDNTAGYESVFKAKDEISGRFKFREGGGTNDKFHLDISIVKNLASGRFSGVLTSDLDSNKLIIKDGIFENIPFKRNSIDSPTKSDKE
ncbi:MAG TPA: hypothetical protein PLX74_12320 [Chitinophagaceae bacterium]|nr:hypothetical protein [Chitinophagaceae bacterium]